MDIPFIKKNKNKRVYGLLISSTKATLLLVDQGVEGLRIKHRKELILENEWQDLTQKMDNALSQIEDEEIFSNDIIFFPYSHFVNTKTQEIEEPYFSQLKKMAKELELKPLGFIEIHEAIAIENKKKTHSSFTGTIIEVDNGVVTAFVYKNGKYTSNKVTRTENLKTDIQYLLLSFKEEVPNQVFIYGTSEKIELPPFTFHHLSAEEIEKIIISSLESEKIEVEEKEDKKPTQQDKEVLGFIIDNDITTKPEAKKEGLKIKIPIAISSIRLNNRPVIFFISFILLFFFVEYFFHRERLIIYPPTKDIQDELEVTEANYIKGKYPITVSGSIKTSGERKIGEKAKGVVMVYNWTEKEKKFTKGTVLIYKGLNFTLTQNIAIPAATTSTVESGKKVIEAGKEKANVEAGDIGESYNIPKGANLFFKNLSHEDYYATVQDQFSGGKSIKIQTVSKDDQAKLEKKLLEKISSSSAVLSTLKKENKDKIIIDNLNKIKIEEKSFDKELGEKARSLSLKIKANIYYIALRKSDINNSIKEKLKKEDKIPEDNEIKDINYSIKDADLKHNKLSLDLKVKVRAIKKIDISKLKSSIILKTKDKIKKILNERYGVRKYEISVTPLPLFGNFSPLFSKNIDIIIK